MFDWIMQGTTPTLVLTVDTEDFFIDSPESIEIYVLNGTKLSIYTGDDLVIDTENNTVSKTFTEEETAALDRRYQVFVQARFFFEHGAVIGTQMITFNVAEMLGVSN